MHISAANSPASPAMDECEPPGMPSLAPSSVGTPRPRNKVPFKPYNGEFNSTCVSDDEEDDEEQMQDAQSLELAQTQTQLAISPGQGNPNEPGVMKSHPKPADADGSEPVAKKKARKYNQEEVVEMFQKACNGEWSIHSYVGNWWQQQLKTDSELKESYDALPDMKEKKN